MKNEPIRVAQIIGKWVGGGVEAVVMNYYRHIDHNKIQFDFICDEDSTNIPKEEIESMGGKVIIIPPYQKVFKYHRELKKVLKEGNYRIVHSHINTLSVFSLFAAKCAKVPVRIAHSHSTVKFDKKEFKRSIMKFILRNFSKVFATNYFACSDLAAISQFGKNAFTNGKVVIINNAIDLEKFKYDDKIRRNKRKKLGIKDDTLVIGHIGRFVTTKNHTFLIDIFNEVHKQNNNSILLLAGQGPLIDEIKEKVNRLNLTDSVRFLGQRNDANELYQAMDLFLLPSLYEGLGMVLIEAQCAGLPCIASTEVPKTVKVSNDIRFLNLSESNTGWTSNILEYVKDHKRLDFSDEIRSFNYDIKKESKKLVDVYLKFDER